MISNIQKFRKQLKAKELCLGAGITLNDPVVVEALSGMVDFVWIDTEHTPMGIETLLSQLIAARAGEIPALVRIPGSDLNVLKRVLDTGAEGIIVPQVRTVEEVQGVVDACRYPPMGNRGWGPRRPSNYGKFSREQVVQGSNEELFVSAQIECTEALGNLDEIVKIQGLDSIAIGPQDLSGSLGMPGQLDHPTVQEAIQTIIQKSHAAGLPVGLGSEGDVEVGAHWANMGADWIQCGSDFGYMLNNIGELFSQVRSKMK